MKTTHFPDLERCKKLTDVGFPENTGLSFWVMPNNMNMIVCPSVSELLDEMPPDITRWDNEEFDTYDLCIFKLDKETFCIQYVLCDYVEEYIVQYTWTLPNALADMYIWLKENNYL